MRRIALVFGVGRYPRPDDRLNGPVRDAQAFARFLKSPRGGSFRDGDVLLRLDADATIDELFKLLRVVVLLCPDELIVYFAGHGGRHGPVLYDGEPAYGRIARALRATGVEHKLVIFDACLSGAALTVIGGVEKVAGANALERYIAALSAAGPGTRLITAASASELTPDDPSFTSHLLDVASVALPDGANGTVSAARVFACAHRRFEQELGDAFPFPQAKGSLHDFPFSVSDNEAPFGRVTARLLSDHTNNDGTRRSYRFSVDVSGRRFLPTTLRTRFVAPGTSLVVEERSIRPATSLTPAVMTVSMADWASGQIQLEIVDELGRQIGPLFWLNVAASVWTPIYAR